MSCASDGDPVSGPSVSYVEADPVVFQQQVVIDGWVNRADGPDLDAIHGHAWDLWAALTSPTDQVVNGTTLPVWETWYDGADLFGANDQPTTPGARTLEGPKQFEHAGTTDDDLASVLTFNRFNRQMFDQVRQNGYSRSATLTALGNEFDLAGTPTAERSISEFANTSVMLKPVFWIVAGDRPMAMPYWAGGDAGVTTDTRNPDWKTWRQCAVADPTGQATADDELLCNGGQDGETTMEPGSYAVLDLSVDSNDLYAFRLTQEEVDGLGAFPLILDNSNVKDDIESVEAGDYAVLVAMHVTTREIANWTWQTFWWTPEATPPASPPDTQTAPATIAAPWDRFQMCAAYSMVTPVGDPDGEPVICFDPYLETNLTGLFSVDRTVTDEVGVHSNCMTCHLAAQVGPAKAEYAVNGLIERGDDDWFADGVRTEFAWSVAQRAQD